MMNETRVQQLVEAGHHQEAWWAYTALAARGDSSFKVYLWGALAAHAMGRIHSALHALEQGIRVVPGEGVGWLRFAHAVFTMDLGQFDAAAAAFEQWISDMPAYPSLKSSHLGLVYYHLGLLARRQDRYPESMRYYAMACECLRRHNRRNDLRTALQNMAWVACLAGDHASAADALAEALPLCERPAAHWHQQIGQAFWLAVSPRGDLRMAMTLCEEIIDYKGDDLPKAVRSHAYWLAGRAALELNLRDTARAMAEQALVSALGLGDEHCLADAYRLIAEVNGRLSVAESDKGGLC